MHEMLNPAGPYAELIARLWWVTLAVCAIVFIAVQWALLRVLRRSPRAREDTTPDLSAPAHSERGARLAVTGATVLSAVLLVGLIIASVATDGALGRIATDEALRIEVTARQWWWSARYDDGTPSRMFETANELHIPVGRPVTITLKSADVIHSFWVPNLHGKKDLIPGRASTIHIKADRPGTYRGQCAEFCGFQHAKMALLVIAEEPARYEAWAQAQRGQAPEPPGDKERRGRELFERGTCAMCHTVQGTQASGRLGPDLTHLGSRQTIAAGTLPNTKGHLAGWILDPQGIKPGARMPSNNLSPDDLDAMLAWLDTLK